MEERSCYELKHGMLEERQVEWGWEDMELGFGYVNFEIQVETSSGQLHVQI